MPWSGRNYDRQSWGNSDPINRALSAANACLNSLCHTAIVSGGYSPALGFVHTGKQLSFVYDIADLYKVEVTVPIAFQVTAESPVHLEQRVRQACRDQFRKAKLLERILPDIDHLLGISGDAQPMMDDSASDPARPEAWWLPPDEAAEAETDVEDGDDGAGEGSASAAGGTDTLAD